MSFWYWKRPAVRDCAERILSATDKLKRLLGCRMLFINTCTRFNLESLDVASSDKLRCILSQLTTSCCLNYQDYLDGTKLQLSLIFKTIPFSCLDPFYHPGWRKRDWLCLWAKWKGSVVFLRLNPTKFHYSLLSESELIWKSYFTVTSHCNGLGANRFDNDYDLYFMY